MLPGFRFLFSAIVLSMSILIFGLGAAALLRAAHEEFASNPTWRAPPETVFAQQNETARPVLATLVVEPPPAELKKPETQVAGAPEAAAVIASLPAELEQVAAKPAQASPIAAARSETPAESSPSSEPAPVQANPAPEASATETRIAAVDKIDAIEATPPPASQSAPAVPEQASAPVGPEIDKTTTKIATLEDPPVAVEAPPPANAARMERDKSAAKKRLRARRARERRRLAALHRAMLAKLAALQPATDLFGQAIIAPSQTTIAPPQSALTASSGRTGRDRRAIGLPPLRP